mgnify:CR=1 FL=1
MAPIKIIPSLESIRYTNHKGNLSENAKANKVARIRHLSANGSANWPKSLVQLYFLAKKPSKKSDQAAAENKKKEVR